MIWAAFKHSTSTEDKHDHGWCGDWCIVKKALDEGTYILFINNTYITYKLNT